MSSRRRLYLNLKQSITKLFKTPAHYLKEMTGKWSIFDKPYLDQDYRAMHLKWPAPTWKGSGGKVPPHVWPKRPGKHTFIFDVGTCTIWSFGGDCGEIIEISGWIWDPYFVSGETTFNWSAVSDNPGLASIIGIDVSGDGISAHIKIQLSDTESGTATICVKATMVGGTALKEAEYAPTPKGWIPTIEYAFENLLPTGEQRAIISHDCGCVDIEVTCCDDSEMAWDSGTSAETIAREASATVAITDSGGLGGPYSWSVSGTGFTLDNATTVGLTNTLNADATACGTATITVTGCDGTVVIGYVRCTTGQWVSQGFICDYGAQSGGYNCNIISGNQMLTVSLRYYDCFHIGYCTGVGATDGCSGFPGLFDCSTSGYSPPACDVNSCWAAKRVERFLWDC